MLEILSKIFIKDKYNYQDSEVRKQYGILTGCVGIFFNVILFLTKFIAGIVSGAISITADAFNNLSDACSSIIALMGFHLADKKPDKDHPFGHGRMEYVTGLIISILIVFMGFELGKTSIERIINPKELESSVLIIVILMIAILIKIYMYFYNRKLGEKINSATMKATAVDSLSDTFATSVVLLSIIVSKITDFKIDGYAGVIVSIFIFVAGIKSIKETINPLLGQAPKQEMVNKVYEVVKNYQEIVGVHDLVIHDYGPGRCMISFHGEVEEDGNINDLHDAIDRCEREINDEIGCDVTIHMDPVSLNDEHVNFYKDLILSKIKEYDKLITIHDFRMVEGNTHTNIIFDAVVPLDSSKTDRKVLEQINSIIENLDGNFQGVIKIDRQYSEWN